MLAIEHFGIAFLITLNAPSPEFWTDPRQKICFASTRESQIKMDLLAEAHEVDVVTFPCPPDFELSPATVIPYVEIMLMFQRSSNGTEQLHY